MPGNQQGALRAYIVCQWDPRQPNKTFSSTNLGVLSQAREASKMPRTCVNTFAARAGVIRTFIIYPRLIIDLFFPSCYLLCCQSGDGRADVVKI